MAWLKLSDNYMDHPKFRALSDGAFRLWHRGLSYSRQFKTDGHIPLAIARAFGEYSPKRAQALLTPWRDGHSALWISVTDGFHIHDYLDWNPSKEEETADRSGSQSRMRAYRERSRYAVTNGVTNAFVLDREREGTGSEESEERIAMRAGELVNRYAELYRKHRRGARYLQRPNLDWIEAKSLCRTWDDARLEKLAEIVLTTDEPFIAGSDRGFKIFAMKATWADDRLSQLEAKRA